MGNQTSGLSQSQLDERRRLFQERKKFDPNFRSIDEEVVEATEISEDHGPLHITPSLVDERTIDANHHHHHHHHHHHDHENKRLQPFHKKGAAGLTSPAELTANQISMRKKDQHGVASSEPRQNQLADARMGQPRRRNRAATLGTREADEMKKDLCLNRDQIPTVFRFYWSRHMNSQTPKQVWVAGSFNNWTLVPMKGTEAGNRWVIIIDLAEGDHQYKFKVDDTWMHNPREKTVPDGLGGRNNVITVHKSDFEVFEALDMDYKDVVQRKKTQGQSGKDKGYGQEIPKNYHTFFDDDDPFGRDRGPPILPPQLLQVILNKDTPLTCEPTLLPTPKHVMLNHMYALSIKDRVMVMSTTQRYRRKYVTTVLYRPIVL